VGSFWTLFLLHYPLSAPVWVGLLSTIGLVMQTGVVMWMKLLVAAGLALGAVFSSAPVYVCPMHPDVTSDAPGRCPKCHMALVPRPSRARIGTGE
jgi:hypothetical protein